MIKNSYQLSAISIQPKSSGFRVLETQNPKLVTQHSALSTKHSERGFTLIEILVALAILSVIITALYSTFFLSHKAINAVDDSLVRMQEARTMLDVIKIEIEAAVYSGDKKYTLFKLEDRDFYGRQASQLSFTAFSPLRPGLSKITYAVEEDKGRLVLRKKLISAFTQTPETKGMDLMEGLASFTVEARYQDQWVKTWDSALNYGIPDEVKITVTILNREKDKKQGSGTPYSISDIATPRIGKTI